jgi:hypothetical protein
MPDDLINTVRAIDDLFVRLAEHSVELGLSCDDLWVLFEFGDLRLIIDREELRVEPVDDDDEQRVVAEQNRLLVAARRAVLWAA